MRNPALRVTLFCSALVAAYLVFLGSVSISVGLHHTEQQGSCMPLLAGIFCILLTLWLFYRISRAVLTVIKKSRTLDLS